MGQEQGAVMISKSTNGEFFMKVENREGDGVCKVTLTAEQFAHAITGKHVKCDVDVLNQSSVSKGADIERESYSQADLQQAVCCYLSQTQIEALGMTRAVEEVALTLFLSPIKDDANSQIIKAALFDLRERGSFNY
ncbi:hypothetical protein IC617_08830 [Neiella sp. HB171785]|uniref:Uncharacterized protein n=1 Tax=Neiella litorisoli TaxID=2771431 RepID=A0A8J6QJX9_9GAMM|nr:hypothetical protein [Neiella litorisoli]MBD1389531.1 hypothetical protein [Neiella litorisoli]